MLDFKEAMRRIRATNAKKGWESEVTSENPGMFSEKMLLVISEISEALEEFRSHRLVNEVYWSGPHGYREHRLEGIAEKPEGIPIEIADAIIRLLDFCEANRIDIEKALLVKMTYNETRPYRHGGRKL